MQHQKTISTSLSLEGIGLHTGQPSKVTFKPAAANAGILFLRTDVKNASPVRADIENLLDIDRYPRRTSLTDHRSQVHTVEHLLSAVFALEIDNILIEVHGEECPGLDGSALPFCQALRRCSIVELPEIREVFRLREPIYISEKGSHLIAIPCGDLKVSYTLDYPGSPLRSQYASFLVDPDQYEAEIAPARTFCLQEEVERLKDLGLGKGSNYSNTLVIGKNGVVDNTFRFEDEPVRHKISDLLGDLALMGNPILAHVIGIRSGHAQNTRLIRKLKEQQKRERAAGIGSPAAYYHGASCLDIDDIQRIIPHRYPFLLVDRVVEIEEDKRAVGIKNVTANEWFFEGHFPGRPVMPGVLIIEAMAQVGGVLMLSKQDNRGKLAYFMSIDRVKFRRTVRPGDRLVMVVEVAKMKSRVGQINGKTYVDGKIAAEATLMFTVVDA